MGLKHSYSLFAPIYNLVVSGATRLLRKNSLQQLEELSSEQDSILIAGIGTGLDIPHLVAGRQYFGIDITPAMIKRAKNLSHDIDIRFQVGDVMKLPFKDNCFDVVVMHLIVAVVPDPTRALCEAQRVLKDNGHLIILDKFLKPGELAPVRQLINPLTRLIATQTNIVLEQHLQHCKHLVVESDEPVLAGGWFRRLLLRKKAMN